MNEEQFKQLIRTLIKRSKYDIEKFRSMLRTLLSNNSMISDRHAKRVLIVLHSMKPEFFEYIDKAKNVPSVPSNFFLPDSTPKIFQSIMNWAAAGLQDRREREKRKKGKTGDEETEMATRPAAAQKRKPPTRPPEDNISQQVRSMKAAKPVGSVDDFFNVRESVRKKIKSLVEQYVNEQDF